MDTPKPLQLSSASIMTDLENSRERFKSEPKYHFPPKTPLHSYKAALSVYCYPRGKHISFQLTELDVAQYRVSHSQPELTIFCTHALGLTRGMLGSYAHGQTIFTLFLCAQIKMMWPMSTISTTRRLLSGFYIDTKHWESQIWWQNNWAQPLPDPLAHVSRSPTL